ncbi:hypothetical protein [Gordonia sp. 852002-51296_SCH5728562-b]|uniref:hypothetical protein n=1 Tax=Gordonia sp. 852002-51296_SCH5728562-b TaxID=1834101 RepID=UPI0007EAA9D3|nr:hypothetical protein [Gordonia sp. 852002-51296_SCH5728562-b]OBA30845.1 hypothetical protein A5766_14970 [Gordonia sp. 852002-51296_SCH5728562-b]
MVRSTASNLDVAMAGKWTISAIGPVEHGGKDRVQHALLALGTSGAHGRVGLVPETGTRRWRFDPTLLSDAVFELDPIDSDEVVPTMRILARNPRPHQPIWVALAGDWMFVYLDHGVGDGFMTVNLSAALFGESGKAAPWQRAATVRHPLIMALLGGFKANPRLPLDVASKLRTRVVNPVNPEIRSWEPSFDVAYARGNPMSFAELMQWRDENAPGVSSVALQTALRVRALSDVGLDPNPTLKLLVDGRRYLPAGSLVTSNFAAGVDLDVADPADAGQLADSVKRVTKSGSAAVTLAATTATIQLDRLRSREPQSATQVPRSPRPNIAITDLGRPRILEQLPWKTDSSTPPTYIALVSPADPQAITFASGRLLGSVQEMASFHDNVFDRDAVQHVVESVTHEPLRLLNSMSEG